MAPKAARGRGSPQPSARRKARSVSFVDTSRERHRVSRSSRKRSASLPVDIRRISVTMDFCQTRRKVPEALAPSSSDTDGTESLSGNPADRENGSSRTSMSPPPKEGSLHRKRSAEHLDNEERTEQGSGRATAHARKRSRDGEYETSQTHEKGNMATDPTESRHNGRAVTPEMNGSKEVTSDSVMSPRTTKRKTDDSDGRKTKRQRSESPNPTKKQGHAEKLKEEDNAGSPSSVDAESDVPARSDGSSPQDSTSKSQESLEGSAKTKAKSSDIPRSHNGSSKEDDAGTKEEDVGNKVENEPSKIGWPGNASSASPFADVTNKEGASESKPPPGFAASAFGKLSASSQSPFGSLGNATSKSLFASTAPGTTGSVFGAAPAAQNKTSETTQASLGGASSSPFALSGASGGKSVFGGAAATSPFSSLGNTAPGKSSFATLGSTGIIGLSNKPAKPFGAAADEDDEEEGDSGEENEKEVLVDETKRDRRFFDRDHETGEEQEQMSLSSRAKIYAFIKSDEKKGEWKERGVGTIRINHSLEEEEGVAAVKARFVMRADGSHRVVLNTPIQKEMKIGDPHGENPKNGFVLFKGLMDGSLELLQLKMKPDNASRLWEEVRRLQEEM